MRISFACSIKHGHGGQPLTALVFCGALSVVATQALAQGDPIPSPQWLGEPTPTPLPAAVPPPAPLPLMRSTNPIVAGEPEYIDRAARLANRPVVEADPEPAVEFSPAFDDPAPAIGEAPPPAAEASAEPIEQIEVLDNFARTPLGQASQAAIPEGSIGRLYAQLAAAEEQYAGDPDFDYSYGLSAIAAGAESEAIFPLQRTVLARPGALGVRLDLARSYYAVGDYDDAKREFQNLKSMNPPPRVADLIDNYLDAIRSRNAKYDTQRVLTLKLESGFDTNANAATDIAAFEGFALSPDAREQESPYAGGGLFGRYSKPLTPRWRLRAGGDLNSREYFDFNQASRLDAGLSLGAAYERGALLADVGARGTQVWLDGEENVLLGSVESGATWRGDTIRLGLNARVSALRFQDELNIRDVDQYLLSIRLDRAIGPGIVGLTLVGGHDEAVEDNSPNSRDSFGATLSLSRPILNRTRIFLRGGVLEAEYDDPFFGRQRDDTQANVEFGLDREMTWLPRWLLKLNVRWLDNDSSVDVFSYDRLDAGLAVQRSFQ